MRIEGSEKWEDRVIPSVYDTDIEAGRQAKKDGIKLIPYREQLKSAPYSYYRYIDTEENRKKMEELRKA